jgi:hypothetical protein
VPTDYLVSFETNRYSVPFTLVGQTVEVTRRGGRLQIAHRGTLVAEHEELTGKYQVRILPEHGPGAIARTARRLQSAVAMRGPRPAALPEVEVRDLAVYDALVEGSTGDIEVAAPLEIVDSEPTMRWRFQENGRLTLVDRPLEAEVRS